jgi:predicted kinase
MDLNISKNQKNLILMCGLSGSGKSSFVKNEILKNYFDMDFKIICRDDIRIYFNVVFDKKLENNINNIHDSMLDIYFIQSQNIICDETNLDYLSIKKMYEKAKIYQYYVTLIILDTDYNICLERRKKLINRFGNYIKSQKNKFEKLRFWFNLDYEINPFFFDQKIQIKNYGEEKNN